MTDPNKTSVGDVPAPSDDVRFKRPKYSGADDDAAEVLRVERWHATYNAALTGFIAFPGNQRMASMSLEEALFEAAIAANKTHGALK